MIRRTRLGLVSLVSLVSLGMFTALIAAPAQAAISRNGEPPIGGISAPDNLLEAHQYQLESAQVIGLAGRLSDRQTITAWQITHGNWNGQTLDGLSMVVVQTTADDGSTPPTTNCYISYLATPAQRSALVAAFLSSHLMPASSLDPSGWRMEPAVIRYEFAGQHVVLHLGAIG